MIGKAILNTRVLVFIVLHNSFLPKFSFQKSSYVFKMFVEPIDKDFYRSFCNKYYTLGEDISQAASLIQMIDDEKFSTRESISFYLGVRHVFSNCFDETEEVVALVVKTMAKKILVHPATNFIAETRSGVSVVNEILCNDEFVVGRTLNVCDLMGDFSHSSLKKIDFQRIMDYNTEVVNRTKSDRNTKEYFNGMYRPLSLMSVLLRNYDCAIRLHGFSSPSKRYNDFLLEVVKKSLRYGSNIIPKNEVELRLLFSIRRNIPHGLKEVLVEHYLKHRSCTILVLEVLVSDDYLEVTDTSSATGRYFEICKNLPLELQCKIAHSISGTIGRTHISSHAFTNTAISVFSN